MTRTTAIAAVALFAAACGPSQTPARDTKKPLDKKSSCAAGDMASCVEIAQGECADKAWQIELDKPPPLYVSSTGLARYDRTDIRLLSTNTNQWLACLEECPGTNAKNVCIPFVLDVAFELDETGKCERSERAVDNWNGLEAKSLVLDCPGSFSEITYVPSLKQAQQALIAAGVITKGSALDVDGMVVKLTVEGNPLLVVTRVEESTCSAFTIPEGYELVRGAEPFEEARAMQPELERRYHKAEAALDRERLAAIDDARASVKADVEALCNEAKYDVSTQEGYATCTAELEAARALITKAVTGAVERFRAEAAPKLDAALREHILQPLCEKFAP